MRRASVRALIATALFLLAGPGTVAGVVPWRITGWRLPSFETWYFPAQIAGGLALAAALCALVESFARFARKGMGTPAPVFPARHLVVSGLYRYVRNPMYLAVVSIILDQALIFRSVRLCGYAAVVWICFHLFVVLYEEPTLRKTFGEEYESFCKAVPRWIPLRTPWEIGGSS